DGDVDRLAALEAREVLDQELRLQRVRVVEVELAALLVGEVRAVAVVVVVLDDADVLGRERAHDVLRDRGLAGSGPSRDADDVGCHPRSDTTIDVSPAPAARG